LPDHSPGFLRRARVTVQTQLRYRLASTAFRSFCAERELALSSREELDLAMQCYLEDLFLSGEGLFMARNAVYGEAFVRELDLRDRAVLRLSRDSLLGWKKLCPESSRNPLPWVFACLIAMHLCVHGGRPGIHAAACLVLQFDAYLRPGVAVLLRRENVVPPARNVASAYRRWALLLAPLESGTTSKTGTRDDSILLGISPARVFIAGIVAELFAQTSVEQPALFPTLSLSVYERLFEQSCQAVGLRPLRFVPHSCRHGGPSTDHFENTLSLDDIQKRGQWASRESVLRYEKHARLLKMLSDASATARQNSQEAVRLLPDTLLEALRTLRL
jgi:hypothetical protein